MVAYLQKNLLELSSLQLQKNGPLDIKVVTKISQDCQKVTISRCKMIIFQGAPLKFIFCDSTRYTIKSPQTQTKVPLLQLGRHLLTFCITYILHIHRLVYKKRVPSQEKFRNSSIGVCKLRPADTLACEKKYVVKNSIPSSSLSYLEIECVLGPLPAVEQLMWPSG